MLEYNRVFKVRTRLSVTLDLYIQPLAIIPPRNPERRRGMQPKPPRDGDVQHQHPMRPAPPQLHRERVVGVG